MKEKAKPPIPFLFSPNMTCRLVNTLFVILLLHFFFTLFVLSKEQKLTIPWSGDSFWNPYGVGVSLLLGSHVSDCSYNL